jgi:hypothetical protein
MFQDRNNVIDQVTPAWAVKAKLTTGLRVVLAWKSGAQHIVRRHFPRPYHSNIASRLKTEVLLIKVSEFRVDFAGEDTDVAK